MEYIKSFFFKNIHSQKQVEQKLLEIFDNYTIENVSNETNYIEQPENKQLIIFSVRDKRNNQLFENLEIILNVKKLQIIFICKEKCCLINNIKNLNNSLKNFKRLLERPCECIICLNDCSEDSLMCRKCAHIVHYHCIMKCHKFICPVCRHDKFNKLNFKKYNK